MLSFRLPNSTTSSPTHKSSSAKKEKSNLRRTPTGHNYNSQQQQQQLQLSRSKSCGEGRASTPSVDEFELCFKKGVTYPDPKGAMLKAESRLPHVTMGVTNPSPKRINFIDKNSDSQRFKCAALCVYLPSFSKAKATKMQIQNEVEAAAAAAETPHDQENDILDSKRISMAKFQWASRSSAAIISENDHEDDIELIPGSPDYKEGDHEDSMNLYFDLPLELIRCTATDSPEKAAFVFTGYQGHTKTFSKNNSSDPLISCTRKDSRTGTTSPHVRFSTE